MLETIKVGEPFLLKDQVEYEKDKAVKKVIAQNDGATLLLAALDHAQLPDHPAPKDAVFTVLDGEGELTYAGNTVKIHHGMSVKFDQGVIHSVKTDKKLKFMLMLL